MSGPYGYGGYGGYAPGPGGYGYPPGQPRPGYPPGQAQARPAGYPPGQPPAAGPPQGYGPPRQQYPPGQQTGYQGYQQPPGYGMPGYRPPGAQPQGYTPVPGTTAGYTPPISQPPPMATSGHGPMVTAGHVPTVSSANRPPMYAQPPRPGPPAPGPGGFRPARPAGPTVPQSFPELYGLSTEELEKLMDNDAAVLEYFESRDDIKRLQEDRSKIVERNETLATENLTLKPQLEEKQQELIALYSELESKRNELSDLQQQQQALADHYAPYNILARLKIAASEVEDETEAIAENFLNGDIAIDEFLKTYIPKKTLCHSRRAKEEKMERMGI